MNRCSHSFILRSTIVLLNEFKQQSMEISFLTKRERKKEAEIVPLIIAAN